MGSVLCVIFTYNREQMLEQLLYEMSLTHIDLLVIDDGSDKPLVFPPEVEIIRTIHEGKQGFWKKWLLARQISLGTNHDYFVFMPDDLSQIDIPAINEIISQGWDDNLFAMNMVYSGERYRWGKGQETQGDFELAGRTWQQCDYVDGCFITNRSTLQAIDIDPVPATWFNRPEKSSGVGYQMTMKLRALGCPMMLPDKSLAFHGDHDSVMHYDHRKNVKLISK